MIHRYKYAPEHVIKIYPLSYINSEVIFMDPSELTAFTAALAVMISNSIPDDDDLILFVIALNQLEDNLDAIIAQRALKKKKEIKPVPIEENAILV